LTYSQWLKGYRKAQLTILAQNDNKTARLLRDLRAKVHVQASRKHIESATKSYAEDYRDNLEDGIKKGAQLEVKGGRLLAPAFLGTAIASGLTGVSKAMTLYEGVPSQVAKEAFNALLPSGETLSERIWDLGTYSEDITRIIDNGLLNKLSPEVLSKQLDGFILADRHVETLTPYGRSLNFDSMRLARTEIINAQHEAQKEILSQTPWITGMTWNTEGTNPCDECSGYDGTTFSEGDIPAIPHPHCLCSLLPSVISDDEWDAAMTDYLENGTDELGIAEWLEE
jgi:hypothetical protein